MFKIFEEKTLATFLLPETPSTTGAEGKRVYYSTNLRPIYSAMKFSARIHMELHLEFTSECACAAQRRGSFKHGVVHCLR